jgi:hypothetical protein
MSGNPEKGYTSYTIRDLLSDLKHKLTGGEEMADTKSFEFQYDEFMAKIPLLGDLAVIRHVLVIVGLFIQ